MQRKRVREKCTFADSGLTMRLHKISWKRRFWVWCQRKLRAAGVLFGFGTVRCLVRGYALCTPSVRSRAHASSMMY